MKLKFTRRKRGILLKKHRYWTVYLSNNQYYLGKLKILLNRRRVIDLGDLKKPEIRELFQIMKIYRKALMKCFKPDLFNYATLGNQVRHHHWHIIPRYKTKRKVNNVVFKDAHWNTPPWPAPYKKIDKKAIKVIRDLILKEV